MKNLDVIALVISVASLIYNVRLYIQTKRLDEACEAARTALAKARGES